MKNEINGRNGWGYQPKPIGPENTDLKGNPLKRNRIPPPRTGKEGAELMPHWYIMCCFLCWFFLGIAFGASIA
jgi:hypothetical protein